MHTTYIRLIYFVLCLVSITLSLTTNRHINMSDSSQYPSFPSCDTMTPPSTDPLCCNSGIQCDKCMQRYNQYTETSKTPTVAIFTTTTQSQQTKSIDLDTSEQTIGNLSESDRFVRDTALAYNMEESIVRSDVEAGVIKLYEFGCFLLQIEYLDDGKCDLDSRNQVTAALENAGFAHMDSSMSRVLFASKEGYWSEFKRIVSDYTKQYDISVKRLLFITDPGMGICLRFPEDRQE